MQSTEGVGIKIRAVAMAVVALMAGVVLTAVVLVLILATVVVLGYNWERLPANG